MSKACSRLPLGVQEVVIAWVLKQLAGHGFVKGDRIGIDASTPGDPMGRPMRCRGQIARRDSGEMLQRLAKESGIETPTADDLVRLDRQRPST